jgi:hypothetical protein
MVDPTARDRLLKIPSGTADNLAVTTVQLFPDDPHGPRPAWQVIDAARSMRLTGELTLGTAPVVRVYLRDGIVYFADRATDGSLGVRLVLEGVLTRTQLSHGTVVVNGAEHLGRLFDRDPAVDRSAVELCLEMFVDEVLVQVADESVDSWELSLYKRHPSGVDRWYPHVTRVVERVVERTVERVIEVDAAPLEAAHEPIHETKAVVDSESVADVIAEPEAVAEAVVEPTVEPVAEAVAEPTVEAVVEPVIEPTVMAAPPPVRAPLPAPTGELPPIVAAPRPSLPGRDEPPTDVMPTMADDDLLHVRLAPAPAPEPAPEPTVQDLVPEDSGNLADDIAEAVRRAMASLESQSA